MPLPLLGDVQLFGIHHIGGIDLKQGQQLRLRLLLGGIKGASLPHQVLHAGLLQVAQQVDVHLAVLPQVGQGKEGQLRIRLLVTHLIVVKAVGLQLHVGGGQGHPTELKTAPVVQQLGRKGFPRRDERAVEFGHLHGRPIQEGAFLYITVYPILRLYHRRG